MNVLTGVELVDASHPVQVAVWEVVEGNQVVVSGHTVNRTHSDLMKPAKEILGHIHGLLEAVEPNVGHFAVV